jgi:hypothetical protein
MSEDAGPAHDDEVLECLDIAAEPSHQVPGALAAVKAKRQPLQVGKQIAPNGTDGALSRPQQQPVTAVGERRICCSHGKQRDPENVEKQ